MNLLSRPEGEKLIVTVNEARIDSAVAIQFKDRMREETDGGGDHIILDLAQVDFIDSSGLGAIVAVMKALGRDRRLDLSGLTENVDKVFRLTRMDSVFQIHPCLEDALTP